MKTAENIKSIVKNRLDTENKDYSYVKIKNEADTADNLDVLEQEELLIVSQKQEVSANINKIISSINLYQALGGTDFTQNIPNNNL